MNLSKNMVGREAKISMGTTSDMNAKYEYRDQKIL